MQFPDIHFAPSSEHAALSPHLQVPESHLFDVSSEQAGFAPHPHTPETQVFDSPVQSASLAHPKILMIKLRSLKYKSKEYHDIS